MQDLYKIEFDSMWLGEDSDGKYHHDFLDNNGKGFILEDACKIKTDLLLNSSSDNKNIIIVKM